MGLEASGLFLTAMEGDAYLDDVACVTAPDDRTRRYLCGETATDRLLGWGVIPADWQDGLEITDISPIRPALAV